MRDACTGIVGSGATRADAYSNLVAKVLAEREAQDILLGKAEPDPTDQVFAAYTACSDAYVALLRLPLTQRATRLRQVQLACVRDACAALTSEDPERVQDRFEASVRSGVAADAKHSGQFEEKLNSANSPCRCAELGLKVETCGDCFRQYQGVLRESPNPHSRAIADARDVLGRMGREAFAECGLAEEAERVIRALIEIVSPPIAPQARNLVAEAIVALERAAWSRSRSRLKSAWLAITVALGIERPPSFPEPRTGDETV